MEQLNQINLLWEVEKHLGSGLLIGLPIVFLPKKWLKHVARVWWLSPNAITLYGTVTILLGFAIYFWIDPFAGFLAVVAGKCLDRVDGKMATVRDEIRDPRFPGTTDEGKVVDPLADKITTMPFIVHFANRDYFSAVLGILMTLSEIVGTFLRPLPEALEKKLQQSRWAYINVLFSAGKKYSRRTGATWIGKVKYCFQGAYLILCLPEDQGWYTFPQPLMWSLLLLSSGLSIISWVSRLSINKTVDESVDEVTKMFSH